MATKRISQLDTIADALVTGEAVLPIVISDPLIPNRKAKINQLFRSLSAGSATAPGMAFDLDRDTGIYQSAVNEIGLTFGSASLYNSRTANTDGSSTLVIRAIDSASANTNVQISPQGSGFFTVQGQTVLTDVQFYLQGDQNTAKRAHFNVDTISSQSGTRRFDLPDVGSSTSTTLVANDTFQTLTNKTVLITDANLSIIGSTTTSKVAKFEVDNWESLALIHINFPTLVLLIHNLLFWMISQSRMCLTRIWLTPHSPTHHQPTKKIIPRNMSSLILHS